MGEKHQEGFTLIELMVLMMVLALALSLGVPAISAFRANGRMAATANDLVSSLYAARSEASVRRATVTLCASGNWGAERPGCSAGNVLDGWVLFQDTNSDGVIDPDEPVLQAHGPVDPSIREQPRSGADSGPPQYAAFRDSGLYDLPGRAPSMRAIQLCDARGNAQARLITISPLGRASLIAGSAGLQSAENPLGGCGS